MNKELIQAVSESLVRLRFQAVTHFKPFRERERELCDFSPGHMHVMGWLKSKGGPVSMTDLASVSFVSKPNLTTMVDRLCADGLVERSADVNDRRVVNVALTEKGRSFMTRKNQEMAAFIESQLSLLDDADLEKLKRALDDLAEVVHVMRDKQRAKK